MKNKRKYIISILVLIFLQTIVLIGAWNLKSGISHSFTIILLAIILSFFTIFIIILWILDLNIFSFKKKAPTELSDIPKEEKADQQEIHKEYIDPKSVAERIFKNVLLKRSYSSFGEKLLQNIALEFDGIQGVFYLYDKNDELFKPVSYYALVKESDIKNFSSGEGVSGQATVDEKITVLSNIPENYRQISSGLGDREPSFVYFTPLFSEKKCIALIELSTFKEIPENRLAILKYLINLGAKKLIQFREKINE